MATEVQMPKQGNSVEECLILEWAVKEGAAVKQGDVLCTIETDKATFEVEAPVSGTLLKCFVPAGELAPVLTTIAAIGTPGESTDALAPGKSESPSASSNESVSAASPAPEVAASKPSTQRPEGAGPAQPGNAFLRISPRARNLSEERGVNPATLTGSGPGGRIIEADVKKAVQESGRLTPLAKAVAKSSGLVAGCGMGPGGRVRAQDLVKPGAATQPVDTSDAVPVEIPYIGIRKLIGDRMMQSLNAHAQLTLNSSADATGILAFRKRLKAAGDESGLPTITLNDMVAAIVAWTLPKFPEVNALFNKKDGKVIRSSQVHLGMAIDTDRGLMVPVIRNAEQMRLGEIATTIRTLAGECRSGKINPDLLSGGTFTITNLGNLGIESFTPVLNTPQVAILGVCAITEKAIPDAEKGFRFQPSLGLSLTIDHQVVDGAPASRFLQAIAKGIADFEFIMAAQAI